MPIEFNSEYIYANVYFRVDNPKKEISDLFISFLDINIYFYVKQRIKFFVITKEIVEEYNLSIDKLYQSACENAELEGYNFRGLADTIASLIPGIEDTENKVVNSVDDYMYVFTNKTGNFGAAGLVLKTHLDAFADKIGVNQMIILPSSIHELIVIPDTANLNTEILRSTVKAVNKEVISYDIYLSDNVYIYNRGGVQICW